jgi:replicative DNA helicase
MKSIPNDSELEQSIIGALLLEPRLIGKYVSHLLPEKFHDLRHEKIMQAVFSLHQKNLPIDLLTINKELRASQSIEQAGGVIYISQLTNRIASTANFETWVLMLTELYLRREFIKASAELSEGSFDPTQDLFDLYDVFMQKMHQILSDNIKNESQHISSLTKRPIESVMLRDKISSGMSGISSGIRSIDKKIGGHQKSDLMYLAGRPSMGKTALALSEILNIASQKIPVAFFSLEMSADQVIYRLSSMLSGVSAERLMKYRLDAHEGTNFFVSIDRLNELPIFIDDTASLSVFDLRARIKRLKEKHKIEIVFIDYIQLMSFSSGMKRSNLSREQELSAISRNMKLIAKECDISLVVLSQLSRAVESRQDKRPLLSDLRESGSLEQDADIVSFVFRPEYYGIKEDETGASTQGLAEFIIAKQRNGATGICEMRFRHEIMRYEDNPEGF